MTSATKALDSGYWVQLRHESLTLGGGFLVTPVYVLTAAHCLRGLPPDKWGEISIAAHRRPGVNGRVIQLIKDVDIALIEIEAPGVEDVSILSADRCADNDPWFGPYRPTESDPNLSGAVMPGLIDYKCEAGAVVSALQLLTFLDLGDYSGYSGGPVERRLASIEPTIVGILIEQFLDRLDQERATNVLFAVTIGDALRQFAPFQLDHLRSVLLGDAAETSARLPVAPAGTEVDEQLEAAFERGRRLFAFIDAEAQSSAMPRSVIEQAQMSVFARIIDESFG